MTDNRTDFDRMIDELNANNVKYSISFGCGADGYRKISLIYITTETNKEYTFTTNAGTQYYSI